MSLSALISAARATIFSSISNPADASPTEPCAGIVFSGSTFCVVPAFISLPQLMQVVLSAKRTWTPPHFGHGSPVRVPPFTRSEAADLILPELSSEDMSDYWQPANFFFVLAP